MRMQKAGYGFRGMMATAVALGAALAAVAANVSSASGNFKVRADESHKGEIGELGASFNYLADQLSKTFNDLTIEKNRLQEIFDVISDGIVVVDSDSNPVTTNEAIKTLFNRAEKNNMFGIGNFAMCFQTGNGITKDSVMAVKLYKKAFTLGNSDLVKQHEGLAKKGNLFSAMLLADCYTHGDGVKRDAAKSNF